MFLIFLNCPVLRNT